MINTFKLPNPNEFQKNNFDLIRLTLAAIVCIVHVSVLSNFSSIQWIPHVLSSTFAVQMFFVISGFLIVMSYERSKSVKKYLIKRARRIYPAYLLIILLSAFGLLLVSNVGIYQYFSVSWIKYFFSNILFLNFFEHELPGVFINNKYHAVNGALWTLKIEVAFYIIVPLIITLTRVFHRKVVLISIYLLSIFYFMLFSFIAANQHNNLFNELARQLPGQMSFFISGTAIYYYYDCFNRYSHVLVCISLFVLFLYTFTGLEALYIFYPAATAIIVMYIGTIVYLGNFSRYGDFSYGLYIVHFPIIQLLLLTRLNNSHAYIFLLLAFTISMFVSILLWHTVEKHFLAKTSHYKQGTNASFIRTMKQAE